MTITFDDPVVAQLMPELMIARRAFPVAQGLLEAPVLRTAAPAAAIGWHDTSVCTESGSIAVVPREGDLADLVGEILVVKRRLPTELRGVYVYVIGSAAEVIDDLSLSRRAFLHLAVLSTEALECSVEVIA